jgi:hypothetical protein
MPKNIDLKEIAERNPRVNLEALEEGRKLHERLCQSGGIKGRRMVLPIDRRRVMIDDDVASDPRAVRLQRP